MAVKTCPAVLFLLLWAFAQAIHRCMARPRVNPLQFSCEQAHTAMTASSQSSHVVSIARSAVVNASMSPVKMTTSNALYRQIFFFHTHKDGSTSGRDVISHNGPQRGLHSQARNHKSQPSSGTSSMPWHVAESRHKGSVPECHNGCMQSGNHKGDSGDS